MKGRRHLRRWESAERELASALTHGYDDRESLVATRPCLTTGELRRFVSGEFANTPRADEILAHIGDCDRCGDVFSKLRVQHSVVQRLSLAAAVAAVLLVLWLSFAHSPSIPATISTIDLRTVSPTRGANTEMQAAKARRTSGALQILLAIGSEGEYECEIRNRAGAILRRTSGTAVSSNKGVALNLPVSLGVLSPGRYQISLRRPGEDWVNYEFDLK